MELSFVAFAASESRRKIIVNFYGSNDDITKHDDLEENFHSINKRNDFCFSLRKQRAFAIDVIQLLPAEESLSAV